MQDTQKTDDEAPSAVELIQEVLQNFDCQPVLFVGAGLARRYIKAPDWDGALQRAASVLGDGAPDYQYLLQKHGGDRVKIGTEIGDQVFEWAWGTGKNQFPKVLFESGDRYVFLKYLVSHELDSLLSNLDSLSPELQEEIAALVAIRPHAV